MTSFCLLQNENLAHMKNQNGPPPAEARQGSRPLSRPCSEGSSGDREFFDMQKDRATKGLFPLATG